MINPVLYMINGFRYGILGTSDFSIVVSFVVIGLFILLLGAIALYLLNKGVGIKR